MTQCWASRAKWSECVTIQYNFLPWRLVTAVHDRKCMLSCSVSSVTQLCKCNDIRLLYKQVKITPLHSYAGTGQVVSTTPQLLYSQGRPSTHCTLGGPLHRSGWAQKIMPPLGFDPWTVQPVVNCYTDYAISASKCCKHPETSHCPSLPLHNKLLLLVVFTF